MHLNDFYEFGSIESNSKKHRNIEKIRFDSVRFGSIRFDSVRFGSVRFGSVRFDSVRFDSIRFDSCRQARKVLEFHCPTAIGKNGITCAGGKKSKSRFEK